MQAVPIVCPEESPLVRPQAHTPCHGGEGRADYGAGVGLAVSWGAHTFLSMAKEKCAKESQRHGDYGKKPLTAHFGGGARNVARNLVGQLTPSPVRAPVLTFFRRQNERAFFPSLPIAALLPRSRRRAYLPRAGWDAFGAN